jgi:hypothetical protein
MAARLTTRVVSSLTRLVRCVTGPAPATGPHASHRASSSQEVRDVGEIPSDQITAHESTPGEAHVGRFSRGQEALPPSPQKLHRGRFSEGVAPDAPSRHNGRFADGVARFDFRRPRRVRGSFAGGMAHRDTPDPQDDAPGG